MKCIFKIRCITLYYRFKNNLLPPNIGVSFSELYSPIHSYPTSESRRCQANLLQEHPFRTVIANNSILNTLPKLINSLSSDITSKVLTHSLDGFKLYAKNFYISSYSLSNCIIPDCYSCRFTNTPPVTSILSISSD